MSVFLIETNFNSKIPFSQPISIKIITRIVLNMAGPVFRVVDFENLMKKEYIITLTSFYFIEFQALSYQPPFFDRSINNLYLGCMIPKLFLSVFLSLTIFFDFGDNRSAAFFLIISVVLGIKAFIRSYEV